jgi:cell shape-determining protein MreD
MSRITCAAIFLYAVLYAIGVNAISLISFSVLLLMIAAAYSYMLRRRLPENFLLLLAALAIAPALVPFFLKSLLGVGLPRIISFVGGGVMTILITAVAFVCFLYVRAHLLAGRHEDQRGLNTNERQPLPPAPQEHEEH